MGAVDTESEKTDECCCMAEYDSEVLPPGRWQCMTAPNGRDELELDEIERIEMQRRRLREVR